MTKALIALVPVIHTSYINLFKKYPDNLYVLGDSILKKWDHNVHLQRDLRRLDQTAIVEMISKSGFVNEVKILEEDMLAELEGFDEIVMPDEDVSRWFAETYLVSQKVHFEDIFLRWNKPVSTIETEVPPDRVVSSDEFHIEMMKKADSLSKQSANWWRQIGTIAVRDGEVIATGFNRHVPTQQNIEVYGDLRADFNAGEFHELSNSIHGEASLVAYAAKEGISLKGTELYVTTFPCPTCAKLVADSGIKTVYYRDGYSLADAEDVLKNAGIDIVLVK